jgi:hypothetical protein
VVLSVSKQARQKFDLERFDLRKLNDTEVEKKYLGGNLKQICSFRELR